VTILLLKIIIASLLLIFFIVMARFAIMGLHILRLIIGSIMEPMIEDEMAVRVEQGREKLIAKLRRTLIRDSLQFWKPFPEEYKLKRFL
jgi:hypothetical protein